MLCSSSSTHDIHPTDTSEHQELGSLSLTFNGKRLEMTQVPNHRGPFNIPWGVHMYSAGWGLVKWVQSLHINMMRSPGYIFEWRIQNYRVIIMECILNIYVICKGNIQSYHLHFHTFLKVHLGACKNIKKKISKYIFHFLKGVAVKSLGHGKREPWPNLHRYRFYKENIFTQLGWLKYNESRWVH